MTEDSNESGDSGQSTRRALLKGIGGLGIGVAAGAAGVYTVADRTDYIDLEQLRRNTFGPAPPEKYPPETEPDENSAPETTPWDTEEIVVSIDRDESMAGASTVTKKLTEATGFWTDYIDANLQFDLALSFEAGHTSPDIRFEERSLMNCFGEYDSPATEDDQLTPLVCVETLTDTPTKTPVTAEIGKALAGDELFELIAKHALGRLIGFDIWTEPVDVMTPKILFGPAHADHPDAAAILGKPSGSVPTLEKLSEEAESAHSNIHNSEDVGFSLEAAATNFTTYLEMFTEGMGSWKRDVENFGYPKYVDAYETTVENDELAYLDETLTRITELQENNSNEEIEGSDELELLLGRLEEMTTWPSTSEMWDVQIHRHYTDAVWAEWAQG